MPVAYNNHNMVLISIHPFAFRKILVLIVALLGLSSAVCFADSIFMSLHPASHNHRVVNQGQPAFFAPTDGERPNTGRRRNFSFSICQTPQWAPMIILQITTRNLHRSVWKPATHQASGSEHQLNGE
jgi:hypothetical protein